MSCLTQARYGISWGVTGAAEACLQQLLDYADSRVLFDRSLSENQAIQIRLADMQRRLIAASLIALRLGQLKDEGKMNPTQVSVAKWNNTRMALDVARDCRDMLGASGISAEYVPIRHMLNLESVYYLRRHGNHSSIGRWQTPDRKKCFLIRGLYFLENKDQ